MLCYVAIILFLKRVVFIKDIEDYYKDAGDCIYCLEEVRIPHFKGLLTKLDM